MCLVIYRGMYKFIWGRGFIVFLLRIDVFVKLWIEKRNVYVVFVLVFV